MEAKYHQQICETALDGRFSPRALDAIIAANLRQDGILTGLVGHPEYHFDDHIAPGWEYIQTQRARGQTALGAGDQTAAWSAFGCLLHAAQDFYSHSSYVRQWAARYEDADLPPVDSINGLDPNILNSPDLFAARVYYPLEAITYFKALRPMARRLLPDDAHVALNLDYPARGPLFPYAIEAARQQTIHQFEQFTQSLSSALLAKFCGQP